MNSGPGGVPGHRGPPGGPEPQDQAMSRRTVLPVPTHGATLDQLVADGGVVL
jgi:hypothetical protein